jgi:prepilin peptidase CpaA
MLWFFGAAIAVVAVAAWIDWQTGNIPNWLTFGVMGLGPVAHVFVTLARTGHRAQAGQEGGYAVLGALLCAVIPVFSFRRARWVAAT